MNVNPKSASGPFRTLVPRVLASLLLLGIVYSVTFGSAHSHRNALSTPDGSLSAIAAQQASTSPNVPFKGSVDGHGCLLCLFHQQFSSSVVEVPSFVDGAAVQVEFETTPTDFYHSVTITSGPITSKLGRAPPVS